MSGSTGNVWATAKEKNNLKLAFRMAKEIGGKELNSYDELVAFFEQVPAEKLIPYNDVPSSNDLVEIVFGPVVESKCRKLMKSGIRLNFALFFSRFYRKRCLSTIFARISRNVV